jgi:predicted ATPase/DNA-binding XRE family transcriptional regulator
MGGSLAASSFAELLRNWRERIGMTQQVLADHATLSVRAIRDIENGRVQRPRQGTVSLLADALRLEGRSRSAFEATARQQAATDEPVAPPTTLNAIVGREAESEVLYDAFAVHGDRLVSLVGLAGVGKTRLAQEVAWRLHSAAGWSVRWVCCGDRGPVNAGPAFTGSAGNSRDWRDGLAELIGDRPTLLVLDGDDGGVSPAMLDPLFRCSTGLRILITTRVPGELGGGQAIPVAPLETPASDQDGDLRGLTRVGSVRLLVSRMRRLRPQFRLGPDDAPTIAALCRYLDGLPRALEFAAGWTLVQSPGQLLKWLSDGPMTLAAPPAAHHEQGDLRESLSEALAMLAPRQRALFGILADRAKDWSVDEAAAWSGWSPQDCLEVVHELFSRGLIRTANERDGARFTVLNLIHALWREGDRSSSPRDARPGELADPFPALAESAS